MNPPPLLGAHFSIAKGLHNAVSEAVSYGCNTLQLFTKNASTWKERYLTDVDKIDSRRRTGVCLDTGHIFAAGYDIRKKVSYRNTLNEFDRIIGLKNLYFIHLNDSKKPLGSKVDRHHHIGEGHIGLEAFKCIMNDRRLFKIPKIIETDKGKRGEDWDRVNLERLKNLVRARKK